VLRRQVVVTPHYTGAFRYAGQDLGHWHVVVTPHYTGAFRRYLVSL
jgi:hypothetical protein